MFKRYHDWVVSKFPHHARTSDVFVIVLLLLALPMVVLVAQQQQDNRQEAAAGGPQVNGIDITYSTDIPPKMFVSVVGTGDKFDIFIHGKSTPRANDPREYGKYNPSVIRDNTFYHIAGIQRGQKLQFEMPTNFRTEYYMIVNATKGNKVCSWEGKMYTRNSDSTVTEIPNDRCVNVSKDPKYSKFSATYSPFVGNFYVREDSDPSKMRTAVTHGGGETYRYYLATSDTDISSIDASELGRSKPVETYNPVANPIRQNRIYGLGSKGKSEVVTFNKTDGTFKVFVASYGKNGLCDWNGKLYHKSSNNSFTKTGLSCQSSGLATITMVKPSPSPTNTPTPTQGQTYVPPVDEPIDEPEDPTYSSFTISGIVQVDTDGNGTPNTGLAGQRVKVYRSGFESSKITFNSGAFSFNVTSSGSWTIEVVPSPGYFVLGSTTQEVNVSPYQQNYPGYNFTLRNTTGPGRN